MYYRILIPSFLNMLNHLFTTQVWIFVIVGLTFGIMGVYYYVSERWFIKPLIKELDEFYAGDCV